jgi:hypothetical protein
MKTTLEVFCKSVGWQGGTIHQAREHFNSSPMSEQDKICSAISREFSEIEDYLTAKWFMNQRVKNRGIVYA